MTTFNTAIAHESSYAETSYLRGALFAKLGDAVRAWTDYDYAA